MPWLKRPAPQRFLGQFPTPNIREIFRANRVKVTAYQGNYTSIHMRRPRDWSDSNSESPGNNQETRWRQRWRSARFGRSPSVGRSSLEVHVRVMGSMTTRFFSG